MHSPGAPEAALVSFGFDQECGEAGQPDLTTSEIFSTGGHANGPVIRI